MSSRFLVLACVVVVLLVLPFPATALQFTGSANDNNGNFHYIGKFSYGVAPQNAPVGNFEVQVQTQQVGPRCRAAALQPLCSRANTHVNFSKGRTHLCSLGRRGEINATCTHCIV